MPKPLWFAWYPSDYLTDAVVMSMSLAQQGAYIRLLSLAACNDGIPDPPVTLIGQEGIWAAPLTDCWVPHPTKPGFLHNPRLLRELEKADAKRAAGTKAVNSRKDRQLLRPYNDRTTTDLLVEKSRVEKRRTNGSIEPLGNLLRSQLGREGKNGASHDELE